MKLSTLELIQALSAMASPRPFVQSRASRAPLRWICHDCSSRLQATRTVKGVHDPSSSFLTRLNFHLQPSRWPSRWRRTYSTTQLRRQSGRPDHTARSIREDLPSQKEGRRSNVVKRFSHVMDHLQSNIFIAGQRLNDLTGYSGIEALKKDIERQGQSQSFPIPVHLWAFRLTI